MEKESYYNSLNDGTPFNLCFLRHGQSTWNRDNRFIGWADTPLTDDGVLEARVAGQMLHKSGMLFDEVHTSLLKVSKQLGRSLNKIVWYVCGAVSNYCSIE